MAKDEQKLPFHYQDKQIMENLLKDVSLAIKDSDAVEEKEIVNNFLRKVSEAFLFVTVGSSGVGKSTFLNKLFQSVLFEGEKLESTKNIQEYRYGVSETSVCVNEYVTRIFLTKEELDGLQVVDMQGMDQIAQGDLLECVKEYLYKSSVVFAIFDARSVQDYAVWDLLEGVEVRKVVFVLTKCDLAEERMIEENEKKLRQYMKEAGVQAPVFRISSQWEDSLSPVCEYVSKQIIGSSPVLTRQQENLSELKKMLEQLSDSFRCRRQQYESDAAILEKINTSLDTFILNNRTKIDDLKTALGREIESEIQAYENEVITKLDPHKIKERFPNGSADFVDYLNLINEGYRKRMTENVNRKTQETVQAYLSELELVFEEATGYLNKRENILALKDRFYGSMAESKKSMVYKAANHLEVTKEYYHTLTEASTELFMKLWKARNNRDRVITNAKIAGEIAGAAAGAGVGLAIANVLGAAVTAIGAAAGTAAAGTAAASGTAAAAAAGTAATASTIVAMGTVLWPVVGVVIGAIVISRIAKKLASANTLLELEKKTAEAIAEFKEEVAKSKEQMTAEILKTIEAMFRMEIENTDKSFSEFRMSVNIEGKNVLKLEEKFDTIQGYLQQIKELERRRELAL